MLQHLSIRFWIGVVELPPREKTVDLFAQCAVGQRPRFQCPELCMCGELGEHSDQSIRNDLSAHVGGSLEDSDHRLDSHAAGRADHERSTLREIASHCQESLQGLGSQLCDQARGAPTEDSELGARSGAEFIGDLQQIADDDLVVRIGSAMFVDGFRDDRRFSRCGFDRVGGIRRQRRAREPDPQMGGASARISRRRHLEPTVRR